MFQQFDKQECIRLRSKLQAVLNEFGRENGVTVTLGNARYWDTEVRFTNSVVRIDGAPKKDEQKLKSLLGQLNLKETSPAGRLVEYNSRRYAYPFIYVANDGKRYKISMQRAIQLFR